MTGAQGPDLVVLGSGSGALTAALTADDLGMSVELFEKAPLVGGGTAYSGGAVWAPCNHVMRRKEVEDSVEDALEYLRNASRGRGDEAIQRAFVENAGAVIEQVERWTGLKWIMWGAQPDYFAGLPGARLKGRVIMPHPGAADDLLIPAEAELPEMSLVRPTPHMDFVPGFQGSGRAARDAWLAGRSIIGGLWKSFLERRIPFNVSTPARRLLIEGGRVTGVEVERPGGEREAVRAARGVVLNTGGFDWNWDFAQRYLPAPCVYPMTPTSNTGEGHLMAMEAGAATALLDRAIWHPAILIPGDTHENGEPFYRMFNQELSKPHGIVVNSSARRFAAEAAYFVVAEALAEVDPLTRAFVNLPAFLICDEEYRRRYGLPGVVGDQPVPDWIVRSESLAGLAEALGLPPGELEDEVAGFNENAKQGVDPRFGRGTRPYELFWGDPDPNHGPNPNLGPIAEPPFYGFQIHLSHAGSRGGLVTTPDAEVVHLEGGTIPGLYACGNVAANLVFGSGYASGSANGSSMVFGHIAARHACA